MAQWKNDKVTTSLTRKAGRLYFASPDASANRVDISSQKPGKGQGSTREFAGRVSAPVDTTRYLYSVGKSSTGRVTLQRSLRKKHSSKRRPKKRPADELQKAIKAQAKKKRASAPKPERKPRKASKRTSSVSRQTRFPYWWAL